MWNSNVLFDFQNGLHQEGVSCLPSFALCNRYCCSSSLNHHMIVMKTVLSFLCVSLVAGFVPSALLRNSLPSSKLEMVGSVTLYVPLFCNLRFS